MWKKYLISRWLPLVGLVTLLTSFGGKLNAQSRADTLAATNVVILIIEGTNVTILPAGAQRWFEAKTNMDLSVGDRIRVGEHSRLTVRRSDQSIFRFGPKSDFQIISPQNRTTPSSRFHLFNGLMYFFHRDSPADVEVETRTASAAVRGTEFNLEVNARETTILAVFDGEVDLSNQFGALNLKNGDQAIVEVGKPPVPRAAIPAINIIQWTLYYPGMLDLDELFWSEQDRAPLIASIAAYRSGDLLGALEQYPAGRDPQSDAERVYRAALVLAVGEVEDAQRLLEALPKERANDAASIRHQRLADALREMIAAVKFQTWQQLRKPELATEWMSESYYQQSLAKLSEALQAARNAVAKSPQFGFGWERVAELEFSFGRIDAAFEALGRALQLSPRNAQAVVLKGFLLAAQNKIRPAIVQFEDSMAIDAGLANAWLGRGLCRIRTGDSKAGRGDLLVAAALEPQRAVLRSYLGKAYTDATDRKRAQHELELAKQLDPRDPTAWLYSALLKQEYNQINDAIRDLEHSQDLSTNRAVYRSQFLLDQDRAVRSANLAHIYRDAGMKEWSLLEAGRAVAKDYANYSAHLFLANSYDELRDPNRINLRYETPAESEYLIANLLAPVGAGTLSQSISQGEYSKLFERDRLHVVSSTEYLSRGAWTENGAQFGTFGNSSYAIEAFYRTDPGQRPNDDFEEREMRIQFKQQLTSQDTIFIRASRYESDGGDLRQYYDQNSANLGLRRSEIQEPILSLGYHHEWKPGVHTLLFASRINDRFSVNDPSQFTFLVHRNDAELDVWGIVPFDQKYRSTLELYAAEAQQIWETPNHLSIGGMRFQSGEFHTKNLQTALISDWIDFFPSTTAADQNTQADFKRLSFYGYHAWRLANPLQVIAGITYDRLIFPENFRAAPLTDGEQNLNRFSPKAGFIWTPIKSTTLRAAYSRSLAGASIDQSLQLEPTQVAGFNQAFRSIIPESIGGAEAGAKFETYSASLEHRFSTGTYLALTSEVLKSDVNRSFGVFEADFSVDNAKLSVIPEKLDFQERSLLFTIDQLLNEELSIGIRYRISDAEVEDRFPNISSSPFGTTLHLESTLHQIELHAIYNHSSGFFGQIQALWSGQGNRGYEPDIPGDTFWQFNLFAGYRFPRRSAELTFGILNIAGQDYRLNPLTLHNELPRQRTFISRLRLNF